MKQRLDPNAVAPDDVRAMRTLEAAITRSGLDRPLIELVKIRASQINGCAYCLHMHTRDARAHGETEERLHVLAAWKESPLFTDRERAALAWTEALTLIAARGAPDGDYERLSEQFSEVERVKLTLLIGTINAWNRLAVGFRYVHPVAGTRAGG